MASWQKKWSSARGGKRRVVLQPPRAYSDAQPMAHSNETLAQRCLRNELERHVKKVR